MGAIGDYVHLKAFNYKKYGTEFPTNSSGSSYNFGGAAQVFAQQKAKIKEKSNIKSQMTNQEKADYVTMLNNLFTTQAHDGTGNQSIQQMQDAIVEKLQEEWGDIFEVDWSTGRVARTAFKNNKDEIVRLAKIRTDRRNNIESKTIRDRIQGIDTLLGQITNMTTAKRLSAALKGIEEEENKLDKDVQELLAEDGVNKYIPLETIKPLVDKINAALRLARNSISASAIGGELFEYAASLCASYIQYIGEETAMQTIERVLNTSDVRKGNIENKVTFNRDAFSRDINFDDPNISNFDIDLGSNKKVSLSSTIKNLTSTSSSYGKTDIEFDLPEDRNVAMSLKNLNFNNSFNNISLVSSSPFLYLYQNQDPNFVNHYLNMTAAHSDSTYMNGDLIRQAREAMKLTVLWQSFTGDTYNAEGSQDTDSAQIFLVNNNSSGGIASFSIFEIGDIVNAVMEDTTLGQEASVTVNGQSIDELVLWNSRSATWQSRISTLIAYTHALKVNTTITKSLLSMKQFEY